MPLNSIIVATGSCIPEVEVSNEDFLDHRFYTKDGQPEPKKAELIIKKFLQRTGIKSRRYAREDQVASDLGADALKNALETSETDINSLDVIIGASNFGDIKAPEYRSDFVPSLTTRVLSKTAQLTGYELQPDKKIKTFDIIYGCPGWLEALIIADMHIQTGKAKRVAVVAMETLSRISDPHDRDSMIYADGAGVAILEAVQGEKKEGILSYASRSILQFESKGAYRDVTDCSQYLTMGFSNNPEYASDRLFLKMFGPNVAQLAIQYIPEVIMEAIDLAGVKLEDVAMYLLHQANETLDKDMAVKTGVKAEDLDEKVPLTISWLGNSSVATIPTLLDLVVRGKLQSENGSYHSLHPGDRVILASIGASMNVNALLYKMPQKDYFAN